MDICKGKWQYRVFLWQQLTSDLEIVHSSLLFPRLTIFSPPLPRKLLKSISSADLNYSQVQRNQGSCMDPFWGHNFCCGLPKSLRRKTLPELSDITEECVPPAAAMACGERDRWPTRFVCSHCECCVLCPGRSCVWELTACLVLALPGYAGGWGRWHLPESFREKPLRSCGEKQRHLSAG